MGAVSTLTHIKIAAAAHSAAERRVCVQYGSAFAITFNSLWNYLKINLILNNHFGRVCSVDYRAQETLFNVKEFL